MQKFMGDNLALPASCPKMCTVQPPNSIFVEHTQKHKQALLSFLPLTLSAPPPKKRSGPTQLSFLLFLALSSILCVGTHCCPAPSSPSILMSNCSTVKYVYERRSPLYYGKEPLIVEGTRGESWMIQLYGHLFSQWDLGKRKHGRFLACKKGSSVKFAFILTCSTPYMYSTCTYVDITSKS